MLKVGKDLKIASKYILDGEIVVFPTETVYGIGADATNESAVNKIFKAKRRPSDNPLIVHISSLEMLYNIISDISDLEKRLIDKFWPGPFSIILNKKDNIPDNVSAGLDTVAVRMPDDKLALKFISLCNKPIAAPSANISSKPSGTSVEEIYEELKNPVSYFIQGKKSKVGIESTVVKVIDDTVHILRPGSITYEDILKVTNNVVVDDNCLSKVMENRKVLSPGMKHKHYSPDTKCVLISSNKAQKLIQKINELIMENEDKKITVMVIGRNVNKILKNKNVKCINLGSNIKQVSKNLFSSLRDLDKSESEICYIQSFQTDGLGLGIMNRLIKACEYDIIDV